MFAGSSDLGRYRKTQDPSGSWSITLCCLPMMCTNYIVRADMECIKSDFKVFGIRLKSVGVLVIRLLNCAMAGERSIQWINTWCTGHVSNWALAFMNMGL